MKSCENCYYADKCSEVGQPCEYYDPIYGSKKILFHEYKKDLKIREKEYRNVVEEQSK